MKNFKNWIEKKIILMRGVPCSGKSTLASKIVENGVILSTDDYFIENGVYSFNPKKLGKYHRLNQIRAENCMLKGVSPIIIDNTMIHPWEAKPYINLADRYNYTVYIEELPVPSLEEIIIRNENRKKDNKYIPLEVIERSLNRFKKNMTIEDIRNF